MTDNGKHSSLLRHRIKHIQGFTLRTGSSLAYKYLTRVEMNDSDQHSSLLQHGLKYTKGSTLKICFSLCLQISDQDGSDSIKDSSLLQHRIKHIRGFTLRVGSSLAYKYQTRAEMTDNDKHASLPRHGINYSRKMFYVPRSMVSAI